jgi:predicted TIM-barrel fold metal-dependent hydrolase
MSMTRIGLLRVAAVTTAVVAGAWLAGAQSGKESGAMTASSTTAAGLDLDTIHAIEMHSHIDTEDGIALLRQERIDYALLMWRGNPRVVEMARQNKDVVGVLPWVVPTQEGYLAKAEAAARKNADVVRGFKLHPAMDHYKVSLELLGGLFELANTMNLMIQSHTEPGSCNAAKFGPLMKAYPKTKLILLHGSPADETFEVINAYENVYVDMSSTAWGKKFQAAALNAVGKKKIVMGLDSPIGFPHEGKQVRPHFRQAIQEIAAFYDHDADVVAHVLYKNARGLLDSLAAPAATQPKA